MTAKHFNLERLRARRGLDVPTLAERANVSQTALILYEAGNQSLSWRIMARVMGVLRVDVSGLSFRNSIEKREFLKLYNEQRRN